MRIAVISKWQDQLAIFAYLMEYLGAAWQQYNTGSSYSLVDTTFFLLDRKTGNSFTKVCYKSP